ncbi:rifin PIR protein, putative [Plasmodium reichenowi]|uniref:Rifin PIR protein, putative n=1 Tax=Plasmodium reichenowi TaxID=5854 RepID=A0A2P9DKS4_PLARE|nr:rifin PIR protein, putative [Plasmodium reichenowi]
MKAHYINILLFAFPLNILVRSPPKSPSIIIHHTPKMPITRLLCECDIYMPNYDNDQQMKEVMDNFNKQTQQRFEEYDDRMKTTRQKYKEQCDKEIQKIILKDKLEKQMAEQFATLQTDIKNDAIPTCVCEKSVADKVEKGCLRCGGVLGGGVLPGFGAIGGSALYALSVLKPEAIATSIEEALNAASAKIAAASKIAGDIEGAAKVVELVESTFGVQNIGGKALKAFFTPENYTVFPSINEPINSLYLAKCVTTVDETHSLLCSFGMSSRVSARDVIQESVKTVLKNAEKAAEAAEAAKSAKLTAGITKKQTALLEAEFNSSIISIYAPIIAIVVIVLIMVIIYLILRYRRKKKMKKKLQYIKLLEE